MDIKVYTDMLESHLLQLLSIIHSQAKCLNDIYCVCVCRPENAGNSGRRMWVEWSMVGLMPRTGKATYDWACELHKGLRKFPCLDNLTIKYNKPRANWGAANYHYGTSYSTGFGHSWDNLEANGGLTAYGQANIPMPAEASDYVTVRLEWHFKTPEGL